MLTYSFHISQFISFLGKNPSLAQFIPKICNKTIIKILRYFRGVTLWEMVGQQTRQDQQSQQAPKAWDEELCPPRVLAMTAS